jgi:hypothetical protein
VIESSRLGWGGRERAGAEEPLPGISPAESRAGIRIHEPCVTPSWLVEVSARMVERQDRIAGSLLESRTPGFTIGGVRAYRQAINDLILIAGIENLTDRAYREHLDFRSENGR